MSENGASPKPMGSVLIHGPMEINMKGNGIYALSMDKELILLAPVINIQVSMLRENFMAKVSTLGKVDKHILATL